MLTNYDVIMELNKDFIFKEVLLKSCNLQFGRDRSNPENRCVGCPYRDIRCLDDDSIENFLKEPCTDGTALVKYLESISAIKQLTDNDFGYSGGC